MRGVGGFLERGIGDYDFAILFLLKQNFITRLYFESLFPPVKSTHPPTEYVYPIEKPSAKIII